ncbi:MAG: type II secretion system GspH family protein [Campylobacter sp.]|uniref:type II secretion system protein n=1 Tax=Campylobacter sp. TaxID=205 RepID=UPI002AA8B011|nr:type II secretion system protein [Campylobacter sp.]MCI6344228.1 type II secretion system GspH family protein [Campylobacter sp.]
MKKGFTMIELIFVIVILGILASVAIPRLAATREDAEISAAVANLRTLVSDATAYYTAKGDFTGVNWNQITNVPLTSATSTVTTETKLKAGGQDCIGVKLENKANGKPAHIVFTKDNTNQNSGVCAQVLKSDPLKPYFESKVSYTESNQKKEVSSAIAIGSSSSVY